MSSSSEQQNQSWDGKSMLGQQECVPISSMMIPKVITLDRNSTLRDALRLFRVHKLRHLVVVNEKMHVQGIFTKRDLLAVEGPGLDRTIVSVANTEVRTAYLNTCIRVVAQTMLHHKIGCMPIVDESTSYLTLVGIVTEADFVRAFAFTADCGCEAMHA